MGILGNMHENTFQNELGDSWELNKQIQLSTFGDLPLLTSLSFIPRIGITNVGVFSRMSFAKQPVDLPKCSCSPMLRWEGQAPLF